MATSRKSEAIGELDPLVGRTISGRYRVHALLGQGGMGKVFQAQQIPLGRAVALKVLSAEYHGDEDPEFQKRFFHEAAILAKLKSPHTVTVFDYGRDGDVFFIAMELLAGDAIDRLLDLEGPMAPERALGIAVQICRSLREAHAQGVIHRDLKPGNVLITRSEDGEEIAKVLDFGLAKRTTVGSDDTNPNLVPGSPKYMPPEAIRLGQVDARADIYSLGVMLYQMLSGVVPFDRPNPMDILVAHLQQEPPPMREANPRVRVPRTLEQLVMRCLAKQPEQRFASMQEVLEAIRRVSQQLGLGSDSMWSAQRSLSPAAMPPRRSSLPKLRLEQADVTPVASRPPTRWSAARILAVIAAVALVAAAGAYFSAGDGRPSAATAEAPPSTSPPPAPDEPTDPPPPDMVFSESDLAEGEAAPRTDEAQEVALAPVAISVRSEPSGARVFLRGKSIGETPMTFTHTPTSAKRPLMMRLEKEGFETYYIRRDIEGEELTIDADLVPSPVTEGAPGAGGPKGEANEDPEPRRHEREAGAERRGPDEGSKQGEGPAEPMIRITPADDERPDEQAEGAE